MMAVNAKITAVSYLNTIPFIYGLRHHANLGAELLLAPPATCYQKFLEGEADIALMPAAMVPSLPDAEVITDYCIGAIGMSSMFIAQTIFLADVVDYGEVKMGFRAESITFSMKGFLQKMAYTMQTVFLFGGQCQYDSFAGNRLSIYIAEGG